MERARLSIWPSSIPKCYTYSSPIKERFNLNHPFPPTPKSFWWINWASVSHTLCLMTARLNISVICGKTQFSWATPENLTQNIKKKGACVINDYFGVVLQDSHHLETPGSSRMWGENTAHFTLSIKQPSANNDFNSACTEFELALGRQERSLVLLEVSRAIRSLLDPISSFYQIEWNIKREWFMTILHLA